MEVVPSTVASRGNDVVRPKKKKPPQGGFAHMHSAVGPGARDDTVLKKKKKKKKKKKGLRDNSVQASSETLVAQRSVQGSRSR